MIVSGIIAEYNPLHNGHAYHIARTREQTGCDYIVAAMSGSFVQRGEPAAFDKWERVRWALMAGADLVLELPAVCCLQSAEGFASGGVRLLRQTGVVTHLSFGSESCDLSALHAVADALGDETDAHRQALGSSLAQGKSFVRAQGEALGERLPRQAHLLSSPNFILAVEYIRAIRRYAPDIKPVPILRKGGGYNDESMGPELPSAKAIRAALQKGSVCDLSRSVPPFVDLTHSAATLEALEAPLLYLLRTADAGALRRISGVGEGFEYALKAAMEETDLTGLLSRVKSKRFTMARIKRILCCALLDIPAETASLANGADAPGYLRVLGFRKSAQPLLRAISRQGLAPLVTQKAQMDALSDIPRALLGIDLRATDIQALAFGDAARRKAFRDFTQPVVVL